MCELDLGVAVIIESQDVIELEIAVVFAEFPGLNVVNTILCVDKMRRLLPLSFHVDTKGRMTQNPLDCFVIGSSILHL